MGVLHKLVHILHKLDPHNEKWKAEQIRAVSENVKDPVLREVLINKIEEEFRTNELDYGRKLYLIKNCLFGVDIQPIAIQICKLRFFISLLVDVPVDKSKENFGIEPLPNLETKFVTANTLIGLNSRLHLLPEKLGPLHDLYERLFHLRQEYFQTADNEEKREIRDQDKAIRQQMERVIRDYIEGVAQRIGPLKEQLNSIPEEPHLVTVEEKDLFETREVQIDLNEQKRQEILDRIRSIRSEVESYKRMLEAFNKVINWDPYDTENPADWFDPEWMFGVKTPSPSEGEGRGEGGFDIVIGNPPHGADLSDYLDKITPYYDYYDSRKNSASFFMFLVNKFLKKDGVCAYIIPKSLSFVEGWHPPRNFIVNKNFLLVTLDISKSFENVRLEQVVVIYKNAIPSNNYRIKIGCGWSKSIKVIGYVEKSLVEQLDIIPCYLDEQKLRIFEKLQKDSILLSHISRTFRGLPWQRKVSSKGASVLRGKNITRYGIKDSIDKIALSLKDKRNKKVLALKHKKIVSQNIVAHVMNPYDHIIVMATLDKEGLLTLDTCMNTILTDSNFTYEYILALLNSTLASWFYYWFVYNRAIRTMHFDEYYLGKLPVKKIPLKEQEDFASLVNEILSIKSKNPESDTSSIEKEIDQRIYQLYGLNEDEIYLIENRG